MNKDVKRKRGLLSWLRDFGWLGRLVANILQAVLTYYGVTASVVGAIVLTYYASAAEWARQPTVYVTALMFLFFLWTYIGVTALRARREVQTVRVAHDYAYGLVNPGWTASLGRAPADDPNAPNADVMVVACGLQNMTAGPMLVRVEDFRVVLDGRSNADAPSVEIVLHRLSAKAVRSGAIVRDVTRNHLAGTGTIRFAYGPPDSPPIRQFSVRVQLQIGIVGDVFQVDHNILEERDVGYEDR